MRWRASPAPRATPRARVRLHELVPEHARAGSDNGAPGPLPLPSAPRSSVTFRGNGQNIIYIDWENDLVVVVRWIGGNLDGFFARVLAAINDIDQRRMGIHRSRERSR